ncbi:hypothetical protein AB1L05_19360 [Cytobacillus horneckiae]|uniref:hypothetical protein n=1 Tax=Cytobacillus horneckiae TaxID=549687 RepID=UPI0039A211D2
MEVNKSNLKNAAIILGVCFVLGSCTIASSINDVVNHNIIDSNYDSIDYELSRFNDNFERYLDIIEGKESGQ